MRCRTSYLYSKTNSNHSTSPVHGILKTVTRPTLGLPRRHLGQLQVRGPALDQSYASSVWRAVDKGSGITLAIKVREGCRLKTCCPGKLRHSRVAITKTALPFLRASQPLCVLSTGLLPLSPEQGEEVSVSSRGLAALSAAPPWVHPVLRGLAGRGLLLHSHGMGRPGGTSEWVGGQTRWDHWVGGQTRWDQWAER